MSTTHFEFKQFTIRHDNTAMKVGTDGILLGAWVDVDREVSRVLDIGTGTGLIALMLAQRCAARIDAVEVDAAAFEQARENAANSPWADRLHIWHTPIQTFAADASYDRIVSNPPFYQHAFGMTQTSRSSARHGMELNYRDLAFHVARLLRPDGEFSTLLPTHYSQEFIALAKDHGLYLSRLCDVYPKPGSPCKRRLMQFTASPATPAISDLTIESAVRHAYTPAFRKLTADFYLAH